MGAVWAVARAQLRRRRVAMVVLALLVGVAGGSVIAAIAGASRTRSAMARFVAYNRPEDVLLVLNGARGDPSDPAVQAQAETVRRRVLALPQVVAAGRAPYIFLSANAHKSDVGGVNAFAAADQHMFRAVERPLLIHGRLARPDRSDEAVVDDVTAAQRRLHVGSLVRLWSFTADQFGDPSTTILSKYPAPHGPSYRFRIVGITRQPTGVETPPRDVTKDAAYGGSGALYLTPAFLRRYAASQHVATEALPGMEIFRVRLRHPATDVPSFERAVRALAPPGDGVVHPGSDAVDAATRVDGAIHLEEVALVVFAAVAALAAIVVLGQTMSRQVETDASEHAALSALGMSRHQLVLASIARVVIIAAVGAVAAVTFAFFMSAFTPLGLARRAEIAPGLAANVATLALGGVAVFAVTVLLGLIPAWRYGRDVRQSSASEGREPRRVRISPRFTFSAAAAAAGSISTDRRGGVAIRVAVVATLVAVTGVVAAVTFASSLSHLVDSPRQQGWTWDVFVGNPNAAEAFTGDPDAESLQHRMTSLLAHNRFVDSYAGVATSDARINGRTTNVAGIEPLRGSLNTFVVQGRAPRTASEIALGADVLRGLHTSIGRHVTAASDHGTATMKVVGRVLQPTAGDLSPRLGDGAVTTLGGLRRLEPDAVPFQFAVRYRPGVNPDAARRALLHDFGREVLAPYPGGEIGNLERIKVLPFLLAGLLVLLAAGALTLTLFGSVRRHHRDIGVLQTLGFVRHQLRAMVLWQASALAFGAGVVGLLLGVVVGRWTWNLVAHDIGSVSPPIVPLAVLLVVPIALGVANLLAAVPAWRASNIQPADALRTE